MSGGTFSEAISSKWQALGREGGDLGPPIAGEAPCPDDAGRFVSFQNGGIYWTAETGAQAVTGPIYTQWLELGGPRGSLGYPISDVLTSGNGLVCATSFQGGRIYWTPEKGTWMTDLMSDAAQVEWAVFQAVLLPVVEAPAPPAPHAPPLPAFLDYSPDANFVRTQAGGGCMTYALMHCIDILKDWEHPYTPAISWHWAEWWAQTYAKQHGGNGPTLAEQAAAGFAAEGSCHSDFDTEFALQKDSAGNWILEWTEPSQAAKQEAALGQAQIMANNSFIAVNPTNPQLSVEDIKQRLYTHGPVWCAGHSHAKAIVGYDDGQQRFIILDSVPHEETGGHNLDYYGYDSVNTNGKIAAYSPVTNIPSPLRTTGRFAYSARIAIEGAWRGAYTVSIGVEGQTPLIVWTTRGRDPKHLGTPNHLSRFLRIDVPLPSYAAANWPPSASHRWFLRVEDHERDGRTGAIKEFTLARRHVHRNCHSVGKYHTEIYGGPVNVAIPDPTSGPMVTNPPAATANPNPGVATVYIGEDLPVIPPMVEGVRTISLTADLSHTFPHGRVILKGQFTSALFAGQVHPVAGATLMRYAYVPDHCDQKLGQWQKANSVVTDAHGNYSFDFSDSYGSHTYAVAAVDAEGTVQASSEALTVQVSF